MEAIYPLVENAGKIDHRFDLFNKVLTPASSPFGDHPYFLSPVRSHAALSSKYTNCSGFQSHNRTRH